MPRLRTLKPGFFKNEDLAKLTPLTRIFFEGLWCWADREGRLEDRPLRLKVEILPYDQADAEVMLDELDASGFILRYEVDGERYIQVIAFNRHQNPHAKEPPSEIPKPQQVAVKRNNGRKYRLFRDEHSASPAFSGTSRVGSGILSSGSGIPGVGSGERVVSGRLGGVGGRRESPAVRIIPNPYETIIPSAPAGEDASLIPPPESPGTPHISLSGHEASGEEGAGPILLQDVLGVVLERTEPSSHRRRLKSELRPVASMESNLPEPDREKRIAFLRKQAEEITEGYDRRLEELREQAATITSGNGHEGEQPS